MSTSTKRRRANSARASPINQSLDKAAKVYEKASFISPIGTTDLNKDNLIIFDIKTNENEYVRFNRDFQVRLELSVINVVVDSNNQTKKELLQVASSTKTDQDDTDDVFFPGASNALVCLEFLGS